MERNESLGNGDRTKAKKVKIQSLGGGATMVGAGGAGYPGAVNTERKCLVRVVTGGVYGSKLTDG